MHSTACFEAICMKPDRAATGREWFRRAIATPLRELVQADGRIRRRAAIPEAEGRILRVLLPPGGETVHNAFFDRSFKP